LGKAGLLGICAVLIGVVVLGMSGSKNSAPVDLNEDSVGYLPAGECMSADKFNAASQEVVEKPTGAIWPARRLGAPARNRSPAA
jgi:hypothetical protein